MTTHRTDHTASRRTALTSLGIGGLGLALAARGGIAIAQEEGGDLAGHPVVGLWSSVRGPETPPGLRSMNAFHGDGTVTSLHSFGGTGVGAWQASDDRSVQMVLTFYNIAQVPGGFEEGTVTLFGTMTVDDAGTTLTEESTVDIRAADGAGVANFPYTSTFVRVPIEAPPAAGTPEAATPAP